MEHKLHKNTFIAHQPEFIDIIQTKPGFDLIEIESNISLNRVYAW